MFDHPNLNPDNSAAVAAPDPNKKKNYGRVILAFKNFDNLVLKPLLLHEYDKELHKKKQEFYEIIAKGDRLEKEFIEANKSSRIS